jgi:NitT/TauT family transport system ATP-binding protein
MNDRAPVLELSAVVKDYRGLRPLRLAALAVAPGERVALGGVDAVAAEVLISLITGAALPDRGEIRVAGTTTDSIADGDAWLASLDRFGIVTERAVMLEGSTLLQNLALPLSLDIDAIGADVKRRVEALAEEVGLDPARLGTRVSDVSAAEKLRAQAARALALDPSMLLLEHPTATLPREAVKPLAGDLAAMAERRGLTALAITEDEMFARIFATRWVTVNGGTGAVTPARPRRRWFG